jgi:hypothetical protein
MPRLPFVRLDFFGATWTRRTVPGPILKLPSEPGTVAIWPVHPHVEKSGDGPPE